MQPPRGGNAQLRWKQVHYTARQLPEGFLQVAGQASVAVGSDIYVVAGRKPQFVRDVVRYDTVRRCWEPVPEPPPSFKPRAYSTATLVNGEVWVLGGSNELVPFGDCHVYDPAVRRWRTPELWGHPRLLKRTAHSAVLHPTRPSCILIHGGYGAIARAGATAGAAVQQQQQQGGGGGDPHTTTRTANVASKDQSLEWLSDLVLLDTATGEVRALQPEVADGPLHHHRHYRSAATATALLPRPRGYHSMTATSGGLVVVVGGKHGSPSGGALHRGQDFVAVYDAAANRWCGMQRSHGPDPGPRSSHRAVRLGQGCRLLIYGGTNGERKRSGSAYLLDVQRAAAPAEGPEGAAPAGGAGGGGGGGLEVELSWTACHAASMGEQPCGRAAPCVEVVVAAPGTEGRAGRAPKGGAAGVGAAGRGGTARLYVLGGYMESTRYAGDLWEADVQHLMEQTHSPDARRNQPHAVAGPVLPGTAPAPEWRTAKRGRRSIAAATAAAAAAAADDIELDSDGEARRALPLAAPQKRKAARRLNRSPATAATALVTGLPLSPSSAHGQQQQQQLCTGTHGLGRGGGGNQRATALSAAACKALEAELTSARQAQAAAEHRARDLEEQLVVAKQAVTEAQAGLASTRQAAAAAAEQHRKVLADHEARADRERVLAEQHAALQAQQKEQEWGQRRHDLEQQLRHQAGLAQKHQQAVMKAQTDHEAELTQWQNERQHLERKAREERQRAQEANSRAQELSREVGDLQSGLSDARLKGREALHMLGERDEEIKTLQALFEKEKASGGERERQLAEQKAATQAMQQRAVNAEAAAHKLCSDLSEAQAQAEQSLKRAVAAEDAARRAEEEAKGLKQRLEAAEHAAGKLREERAKRRREELKRDTAVLKELVRVMEERAESDTGTSS